MAKSNLKEFIIPLAIAGSIFYLLPVISGGVKSAFGGTGVGVGAAFQGAGQGVSTAFQGAGFGVGTGLVGLGQGINEGGVGLGQGINKLGVGAGDIFDSVGGFGGKFFDTGSSFLDIFDTGFKKTAKSINHISPGIKTSKVNLLGSVPSILKAAAYLTPITAPIAGAISSYNQIKSISIKKNKSKPKSPLSNKFIGNLSRSSNPTIRNYENENLISTIKTNSQINQSNNLKKLLKL